MESRQPKVEVRSEEATRGRAVLACVAFTAGDFIGYFEGQPVERRGQTTLQFGSDLHVEPADGSPYRFLNHGCDANGFFLGRSLYAGRDIPAGEQITIDYNCHERELAVPFDCHCGAAGCVGRIAGYVHLTVQQQQQRTEQAGAWLTETTGPASG